MRHGVRPYVVNTYIGSRANLMILRTSSVCIGYDMTTKARKATTLQVVKRCSKSQLPKVVKERRRTTSYQKGGKILSRTFFEQLAQTATDVAPEYLRQRNGFPLPIKGMHIFSCKIRMTHISY